HGGTVLVPPKHIPKTMCNAGFGPTGVCILAKSLNPKTGAVFVPVRNDTVTGLLVTGFPGNGVFGYGTVGLSVTRVVAVNDGGYGISRFVSSRTVFADDTAIGNDEAGFYVGDSPQADTVVRNDRAFGNQFGIFIRHARHVLVTGNVVSGNCQGILVLDDGQRGGVGNAAIQYNRVFDNNKFCKKNEDTPVTTKGGGILLLGATHTLVTGPAADGGCQAWKPAGTQASGPPAGLLFSSRSGRLRPRYMLNGFGCGGRLGAAMTLAARILVARAQATSRKAARKRRAEL